MHHYGESGASDDRGKSRMVATMAVRKLEHLNIVTERLAETIEFYTRLLGLTAEPIPGMPGAGAWLFDQTGSAVVHLLDISPSVRETLPAFVNERLAARFEAAPSELPGGTGAIDHIAFDCSDFDDFFHRLEAAGVAIRQNYVAAVNLRQIFVDDPNQVTIELNFR
jgi:catechol 2,3-dioxygenase-like lactoylglutathione lyase family enzyme